MTTTVKSEPPRRILILGSGVFGLSIAHALSNRPLYANTNITLLDKTPFPNPTAASIDSTRIIRADYADPLYSALAREAQTLWRQPGPDSWGSGGRYNESGLCLVATREGATYVHKSLRNVRDGLVLEGAAPEAVRELNDKADIAAALGLAAEDVDDDGAEIGYLNTRSGWADAEATMRWLRGKVEQNGRVNCITGEAARLLHDPHSGAIIGAQLASGATLEADLTILATGAWTPALLDLRGVASARAQCMAYVSLSAAEAARYAHIPVLLDLSSGCFFFPPTASATGWEMKVARHAFGYAHPTPLAPTPLPASAAAPCTTASLPPAAPDAIPAADAAALAGMLHRVLPGLYLDPPARRQQRPFAHTRICSYLDTRSADFLVCPVPAYGASLFLATGGSGHAFKFLPVLGEKCVDVLEAYLFPGREEEEGGAGEARPSTRMWKERWAWRERGAEDEVWCEDGSRAGVKGLVLSEAMAS